MLPISMLLQCAVWPLSAACMQGGATGVRWLAGLYELASLAELQHIHFAIPNESMAHLATAGTVVLQPPLPLAGVSTGQERGCQQNNSTRMS